MLCNNRELTQLRNVSRMAGGGACGREGGRERGTETGRQRRNEYERISSEHFREKNY